MSVEENRAECAAGYVIALLGFVPGSALLGVSLGLSSLTEELTLSAPSLLDNGLDEMP